jgi:hypothetical protein
MGELSRLTGYFASTDRMHSNSLLLSIEKLRCGAAQHTVDNSEHEETVRGDFQSTTTEDFIDEHWRSSLRCGTAEPIPGD